MSTTAADRTQATCSARVLAPHSPSGWAETAHTGQRGERSGGKLPGAGRDSPNSPGRGCGVDGAGRVRVLAARGVAAWSGLPRGRCTSWSAISPSGWRSPRTGGRARRRAAPGPCRRPSLPRGDVSRWCCSSPGSPRTPFSAGGGCVPACPRHRHDGCVAAACGVVVGVRAVLGVLREHRAGSSAETPPGADGPVRASAGHGHDCGVC